MEQSKRNQGSTKMAVKMGAGAGGIGAVFLLGGALATAALASAFFVGIKGRSSGKNRRLPKSPPRDEPADKTHQFNVLENKNPSNGAIKEVVESDNSNHGSALDEKPGVEEINICDVEASGQSLCCIGPEKLETDAISDGSVVIIEEKIPLLDEKLQFEPRNEDADNEIPEEGQKPEGVRIGGEMAESEPTDDECGGEIKEACHQEAVEVITAKQPVQEDNDEEIKVILVDNSIEKEVHVDRKEAEENVDATEEGELDEEKRSNNRELILSESHIKDGQNTILPLLGSPAMGHENTNGEEKEGQPFPSETMETVKECEFIVKQLVEDGQKTIILPSLHVGHGNANGEEKEDRPFPSETVKIVKKCEFIEEQLIEDGEKTILPALGSLDVGHENANGKENEGRPFSTDTVEIVKECYFIEEQLVEDDKKTILSVLGCLVVGHENSNGEEKGQPFPTNTLEIKKVCEFIEEQLVEDGQKTILPELGSLDVGHENANGKEKEGRPFPTNTLEIEKECEFIEEQLVEDGQKTILPVLDSLDENATSDEKEGRPFPTDTVEIVKESEFIEEQSVEDGQKTILDVLGNRGVEHEDMNGDEEKNPLAIDTAEIILKDSELIEGGEEDDQMKKVENHLVKEQENCGEADELIVVKKYEDPIEVTGDELEEGVISVHSESIQATQNHENNLEPEIEKEAEEEPNILGNVEVTKEDNAMNEEVVGESTEAIAGTEISPETVTAGKGDFPITEQIEDGEKGENLTEDSVEETVLSDRVQLTYQEVEGKIQEDKEKVELGDEKEVNNSRKAFIGKYVADLAALNGCLTDSTSRRMMIVTLSAVSSVSCSWFFGLSFVRFCLVLFLTMVLSSMVATE